MQAAMSAPTFPPLRPPHPTASHAQASSTTPLEVENFSHVGLRRQNNEDAILAISEGNVNLFAVADGIGGCSGGEVAAALTVGTLQACSKSWSRSAPTVDAATDRANALLQAVDQANLNVLENARRNASLQDMGTTVVACSVIGDTLIVAHLGDSRLYLQRGKELYLLTKDHVVSQWADHGYRLVLSKCVGFSGVQAEIKLRIVRPGDVILLCSDGLYGEVDDDEALSQELAQVTSGSKSLADAASSLLETALKNGGRDNVSAVLVRVL